MFNSLKLLYAHLLHYRYAVSRTNTNLVNTLLNDDYEIIKIDDDHIALRSPSRFIYMNFTNVSKQYSLDRYVPSGSMGFYVGPGLIAGKNTIKFDDGRISLWTYIKVLMQLKRNGANMTSIPLAVAGGSFLSQVNRVT